MSIATQHLELPVQEHFGHELHDVPACQVVLDIGDGKLHREPLMNGHRVCCVMPYIQDNSSGASTGVQRQHCFMGEMKLLDVQALKDNLTGLFPVHPGVEAALSQQQRPRANGRQGASGGFRGFIVRVPPKQLHSILSTVQA